uniref:Uncharacterized protein n=1 Tax=Oryza meridionalis TaxID=40149 RepID=A0A0E0DYM4_9ORYZ
MYRQLYQISRPRDISERLVESAVPSVYECQLDPARPSRPWTPRQAQVFRSSLVSCRAWARARSSSARSAESSNTVDGFMPSPGPEMPARALMSSMDAAIWCQAAAARKHRQEDDKKRK